MNLRAYLLVPIAALVFLPVGWYGYKFFAVTLDSVILSNTSGNNNGILVVGNASPPMVYKSFTSATNNFWIGRLTASAGNNEVVAFTNQRAVAIQNPVTWTSGVDTVKQALTGPITIDVSVWVVVGPFKTQSSLALDMQISAKSIWDQERMGVTFGAFDIHDATKNPAAATYKEFTDCSMRTAMQTAIGKDAGRINIYIVDLVQGILGRGQACGFGTDFVVVGSSAGAELLAHEIGHDFTLEHVDTLAADFDQTNVMYSASDTRQYFTEGQLFRAHLAGLSTLNWLYNARTGQPTRTCAQLDSSDTCPPIAKRIWADGAKYPPN